MSIEIQQIFFSISNFHFVLNVVSFLLCESPAFEFYVPTFRPINFRRRWITQKKGYNKTSSRLNFMVTPCINNIHHFNNQLTHTTLKKRRVTKTF